MNYPYPPLRNWSEYARISFHEFTQRFPAVTSSEAIDDVDDFMERHADHSIILISGDVSITQQQFAELCDDYHVAIAVDGNLDVDGYPSKLLYVSGDLHCDTISLDYGWDGVVDGRIVARHYFVSLDAEDDEVMNDAPHLRVDTPFLFSWFYGIDNLDLQPETVIFILGDWDYCHNLALPNAVFPWHEVVHVLRQELVDHVDYKNYDGSAWSHSNIKRALKSGQNIFIDGFDIACIEYQKAGQDAMTLKDHRAAYLAYKKSASLSPAYYCAWLGMADALFQAGAYEQALQHYQEAATRFPSRQTGLLNRAANFGARSAIRCRQLPLAIELASQSIKHNQELEYDTEDRAHAYRFRAEAHYLSGHETEAFSDLETALSLDDRHVPANWLMGLLHYRRGERALANKYHRNAADRNSDFSLTYDKADNTDFLAGDIIRVDWDTQDLASYALPVKDEVYWRAFMRNSDPMKIKQVPQALRSAALCMEILLDAEPGSYVPFVKYFPASSFTRDMAEHLVRRSPRNLEYIPQSMIDKSLCMLAPQGEDGFEIAYVPKDIVDYDVCLRVVQCGEDIDKLPHEFIDKALCLAAVHHSSSGIDHIPAEFLDDALYLVAIVYGNPYFFDNSIPGRYKTTAMLKKAIAYDKRALDAIAGHRFDAELYAHAQALYGQDADWADIGAA